MDSSNVNANMIRLRDYSSIFSRRAFTDILEYNDGEVSLAETIIKKKIIDAISADLSKPLRRYDSELEYVPTQLICEYCRHIVNADGITLESSLHIGGRNYVLFDAKSAKCVRVNLHEITTIDIDK